MTDEFKQVDYGGNNLAAALNNDALGMNAGWELVGVVPLPCSTSPLPSSLLFHAVFTVRTLWKREKPEPTPQEILAKLDLPSFIKSRSIQLDENCHGLPYWRVNLVVSQHFGRRMSKDVSAWQEEWRAVRKQVEHGLLSVGTVSVHATTEPRKKKIK